MDIYGNQSQATNSVGDDLKLIHGIGPGIENRLHTSGIFTYHQLALMTPKEITDAIGKMVGMTVEKITVQDWIGQARGLAINSKIPATTSESMVPNSHQHYAAFTVELLLDEENNTRRTRTLYVQGQSESTWSGWDESRLIDFITTNAGLSPIKTSKGTSQGATNLETVRPQASVVVSDQVDISPEIKGEIQLQKPIFLKDSDTAATRDLIDSDRSFNAKLVLNLSKMIAPPEIPLRYSALVFAKKIGGTRHLVNRLEGSLIPREHVDLNIPDLHLPRGAYWMDVFVEINPTGCTENHKSGLIALKGGNFLQVY